VARLPRADPIRYTPPRTQISAAYSAGSRIHRPRPCPRAGPVARSPPRRPTLLPVHAEPLGPDRQYL